MNLHPERHAPEKEPHPLLACALCILIGALFGAAFLWAGMQ